MGSGIRDDALYLLNGDALEKLGRDLLRGEVVGVIQYRVQARSNETPGFHA